MGTHSKDEKPAALPAPPSDLAAAVRRARVENAERAEAITDLREIEAARLALLESALKPVVGQAPPGVDLFDLALAPGDHPRLFIDMIAFVDMARDRRTYRFYQDTRHGRVLIAQTPSIDKVAAAVTNYVARRLVERERALASGPRRRGGASRRRQGSARLVDRERLGARAGADRGRGGRGPLRPRRRLCGANAVSPSGSATR